MTLSNELKETFTEKGIFAKGKRVEIMPLDDGEYLLITQKSTPHSRRHYFKPSYESALNHALAWQRKWKPD